MAKDQTETLSVVATPALRSRGRLVVSAGPDKGATYEVVDDVSLLGRDETADFVLHGEGVSRHHAKVLLDADGGVQVVDLGAKNGTYVNGKKIKAAQLEHGDAVQLGRAVVTFEREAIPPRPEPSPEDLELTPRELEIGLLVAKGLTNAEVGEVLGISRATVATHLQRAYKRLNFGSRAELARYVAERT